MPDASLTWDNMIKLLERLKTQKNHKEITKIQHKLRQLKDDGLTPDQCLLTVSGIMMYLSVEMLNMWEGEQ